MLFRMSFSLVEGHWAYHTQGQAPCSGAVGLRETNSMAFSWMFVLFWLVYGGKVPIRFIPICFDFCFCEFSLCLFLAFFFFFFLGEEGG